MTDYEKCLTSAKKRYNNSSLKLCPRGYCSAKQKFEVYPSAYANGYATQVCKGTKDDYLGDKYPDNKYLTNLNQKVKNGKMNSLQRWYKEEWVNVCDKGNGPGGFKICGSGDGIDNPTKYPYCRAYNKLPGTTVVTAQELTQNEIDTMCKDKRSKKQGINKKPTRVYLSKNIKNGGNIEVLIPNDVKEAALQGLLLIDNGFSGGTKTGWNRGNQLANSINIDTKSLADMRTWFARHGPDAQNGGTSYQGYCKWLHDGKPDNVNKNSYRGAVSWLIWGGDASYKWLKSSNIRNIIETEYPNRKKSSKKNNLGC